MTDDTFPTVPVNAPSNVPTTGTPTFTMSDNEEAASLPSGGDHPALPEGTVITKTLADGELIAHVPNKRGGFYRFHAGIGADPEKFGAQIAAKLKAFDCL